MRLLWEDRAWNDYLYWQTQDKKTLKRINSLTNHAKNSPTSIGGEMNWHKKLSLDNRKKIEYT